MTYRDRLKSRFEENPELIIALSAATATAVGGLFKGAAQLANSRTWAKEVKRRQKL